MCHPYRYCTLLCGLFMMLGLDSDDFFFVIYTDTREWCNEEIQGTTPTSRRGATATPVYNRFIVVYGGASESKIFTDVYIFDTGILTLTCITFTPHYLSILLVPLPTSHLQLLQKQRFGINRQLGYTRHTPVLVILLHF